MQESDVILCENSIDFAMKSQNPLDNVHFFDNFDSQDKYPMKKTSVSPMYPDIFQERKLRAYSRVKDEGHVDAIRIAFDRWVNKMWGDQVVTSTPLRHTQMQLREPVLPARGMFVAPREQVQQRANLPIADSNGPQNRLEKKRKIQLDTIPE